MSWTLAIIVWLAVGILPATYMIYDDHKGKEAINITIEGLFLYSIIVLFGPISSFLCVIWVLKENAHKVIFTIKRRK